MVVIEYIETVETKTSYAVVHSYGEARTTVYVRKEEGTAEEAREKAHQHLLSL